MKKVYSFIVVLFFLVILIACDSSTTYGHIELRVINEHDSLIIRRVGIKTGDKEYFVPRYWPADFANTGIDPGEEKIFTYFTNQSWEPGIIWIYSYDGVAFFPIDIEIENVYLIPEKTTTLRLNSDGTWTVINPM